jgi:hypothetical protein
MRNTVSAPAICGNAKADAIVSITRAVKFTVIPGREPRAKLTTSILSLGARTRNPDARYPVSGFRVRSFSFAEWAPRNNGDVVRLFTALSVRIAVIFLLGFAD